MRGCGLPPLARLTRRCLCIHTCACVLMHRLGPPAKLPRLPLRRRQSLPLACSRRRPDLHQAAPPRRGCCGCGGGQGSQAAAGAGGSRGEGSRRRGGRGRGAGRGRGGGACSSISRGGANRNRSSRRGLCPACATSQGPAGSPRSGGGGGAAAAAPQPAAARTARHGAAGRQAAARGARSGRAGCRECGSRRGQAHSHAQAWSQAQPCGSGTGRPPAALRALFWVCGSPSVCLLASLPVLHFKDALLAEHK